MVNKKKQTSFCLNCSENTWHQSGVCDKCYKKSVKTEELLENKSLPVHDLKSKDSSLDINATK